MSEHLTPEIIPSSQDSDITNKKDRAQQLLEPIKLKDILQSLDLINISFALLITTNLFLVWKEGAVLSVIYYLVSLFFIALASYPTVTRWAHKNNAYETSRYRHLTLYSAQKTFAFSSIVTLLIMRLSHGNILAHPETFVVDHNVLYPMGFFAVISVFFLKFSKKNIYKASSWVSLIAIFNYLLIFYGINHFFSDFIRAQEVMMGLLCVISFSWLAYSITYYRLSISTFKNINAISEKIN